MELASLELFNFFFLSPFLWYFDTVTPYPFPLLIITVCMNIIMGAAETRMLKRLGSLPLHQPEGKGTFFSSLVFQYGQDEGKGITQPWPVHSTPCHINFTCPSNLCTQGGNKPQLPAVPGREQLPHWPASGKNWFTGHNPDKSLEFGEL